MGILHILLLLAGDRVRWPCTLHLAPPTQPLKPLTSYRQTSTQQLFFKLTPKPCPTGISLLVTVYADRVGRRSMLLLGCGLKLLGGAILATVHGPLFWLLAVGCTVGVISPSGNEVR